MKTIVGLFDNQEDVRQAIDELSKQEVGQNLTLITAEQVLRKPPSFNVNQLVKGESDRVVGDVESSRGDQASWDRSGWGSYISRKTIERVGVEGIGEILGSRGVGEQEAQFYAEGVKHGGMLLLVDAEQEEISTVQQLIYDANAVKMGNH